MPARRIDATEAKAADARLLQRVRDARKKPRAVTEREIQEFERMRRSGFTQCFKTITIVEGNGRAFTMTMRPAGADDSGVEVRTMMPSRGEPVVEYREITGGKRRAGQASPVWPAVRELLEIERDDLSARAKKTRTRTATDATACKAATKVKEIRAAEQAMDAEGKPVRNRPKRLAKACDVSVSTVNRARRSESNRK